jgi:hypothetical protein
MVESMLAQMSLHSTETEIETLLGAIYDLENEPSPHVAATAAALAERYVRDIGDLSAPCSARRSRCTRTATLRSRATPRSRGSSRS